MILCDRDLRTLLDDGFLTPADENLINPASIDVRLGTSIRREMGHGTFVTSNLAADESVEVQPGEFILISTMEMLHVPLNCGCDLRLKSTSARSGWNAALAFWLDPGYQGRPTMELQNMLRYNTLTLAPGVRFAQAVVHRLSGQAVKPYAGRYQGDMAVSGAKAGTGP